MSDLYFDLNDLLKYLNERQNQGDEPLTKAVLDDAVHEWMNRMGGIRITRCRDCNTCSTVGIQDGFGWCKKFCFGPENDFFCLMAAPWEAETEDESEDRIAHDTGTVS